MKTGGVCMCAMTTRLRSPAVFVLLCVLLLIVGSLAQESNTRPSQSSLVLIPSATGETRYRDGLLNDGCDNLSYVVAAAYPPEKVLTSISDELRRQNWMRARKVSRRWTPGSPYSFETPFQWEHFVSVAGGTTYVRADQWEDKAGDLTSYAFWYFGPNLTSLRVEGRYCPLQVINKYRCRGGPLPRHDEKAYSLVLNITKVEPIERNFKVFVHIQNAGTRPVLIGLNGKLADGAPELWVLGLEQKEQGQWGSVDAVCAEHPAADWITLKPGESIGSWAMAVDFPEPNHGFAKCRRPIAHPHGQIRATIGFYTDVCEIEGIVRNRRPYVAKSQAIDLPATDR